MRVRVSVANLVVLVLVQKDGIDVGGKYIGVLSSGAYKKGKKRYQPIGGAASLTEAGQHYLEERFWAENFHKSEEGSIDARFEVDDCYLDEIFMFFRKRDPQYFEIDPLREIREELSTVELKAAAGLPEIPAVLTEEEAGSISVEYARTVVQPFTDEVGTSILAKEGVPSRRLFHQFIMKVSQEVYDELRQSEAVRLLDEKEVESTEGGAHKGITKDGIELADNFISV